MSEESKIPASRDVRLRPALVIAFRTAELSTAHGLLYLALRRPVQPEQDTIDVDCEVVEDEQKALPPAKAKTDL